MSEPPRFNNPAPDPEASAAELLALRQMAASRGLKVIRLLAMSWDEHRSLHAAAIIEPDTERSDVWIWGDPYKLPIDGLVVARDVLVTRKEYRGTQHPLRGRYDLYYVGDEESPGVLVGQMEGRALDSADRHLGQPTNAERDAVFSARFQAKLKAASETRRSEPDR